MDGSSHTNSENEQPVLSYETRAKIVSNMIDITLHNSAELDSAYQKLSLEDRRIIDLLASREAGDDVELKAKLTRSMLAMSLITPASIDEEISRMGVFAAAFNAPVDDADDFQA